MVQVAQLRLASLVRFRLSRTPVVFTYGSWHPPDNYQVDVNTRGVRRRKPVPCVSTLTICCRLTTSQTPQLPAAAAMAIPCLYRYTFAREATTALNAQGSSTAAQWAKS